MDNKNEEKKDNRKPVDWGTEDEKLVVYVMAERPKTNKDPKQK